MPISPTSRVLRFALTLMIAPFHPGSAQSGLPIVAGELGQRLDQYMTRLADAGYAGGVLVARQGQVVLKKGYGLADRERKIPIDLATVFSVGSITKQFTAAAILRLEQDGKLRVEDSIGRFLPEVPPDKAGITLHHLLTHTAGLRSDYAPSDYDPVGRDEYVRRALQAPLESGPGERYFYSNAGYSLLGAIIEIASGEPYERYLHDHLFQPAGMAETGYRIPQWQGDRVAHGYLRGRDWGTILERPWAPDGPWWPLRANGGIHTTLEDMYRWNQALDSDLVLSAEERGKLFSPYVREGPGAAAFYAYGWAVLETPRGTTLITHNGGNGVYVAELQRFTDEGVLVFLTSTVAEFKATAALEAVDRIVFGGQYQLPPEVAPVPSGALNGYAGTYRLPSGDQISASVVDGRLTLSPVGQGAMALLRPSDSAPELGIRSARTVEIVAAQTKGDFRPLFQAMGGQVPLTRLQRTPPT